MVLTLCSVSSFALHEGFTCGTDEAHALALEQHPELAAKRAAVEAHIQKWIAEHPNEKDLDVITIPLVFHIVHSASNPASNVSDEDIWAHIQILNDLFRRNNADASETLPVFQPFAADTELEFCLAVRNPDGHPTTGITRTETTTNTWVSSQNFMKRSANGGKDAWPTDQYLNIWVCNEIVNPDGDNLGGYSYVPGNAPSADVEGVALIYTVIDDAAKTTAHEVGHYLSLFHPWGQSNSAAGCFEDDLVSDTPITAEPVNFNCPLTQNSCSNESPDYNDMVQNYMDYSNENCQNLFTLGQKARMRAVLAPGGARHGITQTNNCIPLNLGDNDVDLLSIEEPFGAGVCTTVEPKIIFENYANLPLFYVAIDYFVDGGEVQSTFWTDLSGTGLAPFDTVHLTLPAIHITDPGLIHTITVTLLNPNGVADSDLTNNVITKSFATTSEGEALPIVEGFEGTEFPPEDWEIENNDGTGFMRTTTAARSGMASVMLDNFGGDPALGQIDALTTLSFNLEGVLNPVLEFYMAYALMTDVSPADLFGVEVSIDCGDSFVTVAEMSGEEMVTANPTGLAYIPSANDWQQKTIDLAEFEGARNVLVKFRHVRVEGNNLYLDDINIKSGAVGIDDTPNTVETFHIYPNPANQLATIAYTGTGVEDLHIQLVNVAGQVVLDKVFRTQVGTQLLPIDLGAVEAGMYFLTVNDGQLFKTEKLMVVK